MTTSSAPRADTIFVLQTDAGTNLLMCVAPCTHPASTGIGWWPLCEIDLTEEPFTRLSMDEEQEHQTDVAVAQTDFWEIANWLAEHDGYWSVRGILYPYAGDVRTPNPYRFSFSDPLTATEFKLRWG